MASKAIKDELAQKVTNALRDFALEAAAAGEPLDKLPDPDAIAVSVDKDGISAVFFPVKGMRTMQDVQDEIEAAEEEAEDFEHRTGDRIADLYADDETPPLAPPQSIGEGNEEEED